ncbi:MAG: serine--tRNA ligase, partial [Elusimicrobia bacterium]|nr:serine--tRNA ligase [Elusimicrobiota bacterium]
MDEVAVLKTEMPAKEGELSALEKELREVLLGIPNLPDPGVPVGK